MSNEPKAWVGCLHCYNSGRLIGDWFDKDELIDAEGSITLESVHTRGGYKVTEGCEELWVMDHENIGTRSECDVTTAQAWAEAYEDLGDDDEWLAYLAYADNVHADLYGMPDVSDFQDRYHGTWDSFEDYGYEFIESTVDMRDWPETLRTYFDYDGYIRDLKFDYTVLDAPGYQVFIFSDY